ncbi:lytic transglycosylase domain-containing protein [Hydrocarboniphaga effusa]|uniref:lytic transglycosylase domain-containing protein n=1 Tax=Hydrocarboniphaga effusa TaxID=243629 RepID=UPI003BA9C432
MSSKKTQLILPSAMIAKVIAAGATDFGLPYDIVLAVCRKESSLNPWAARYEPDYRYLWDCEKNRPYNIRAADMTLDRAPDDFAGTAGATPHTEWIAQQTSYGLMQPMGALARELGFKGYLSQLFNPVENVAIGCRHLRDLHKRHYAKFGWAGTLAAYNAGSPRFQANGKTYVNQQYVDGVFSLGAEGYR